jgi:hypothetical protein
LVGGGLRCSTLCGWGQSERRVEAGGELACPGPDFGDADFAFALAAHDASGGVQQPITQGVPIQNPGSGRWSAVLLSGLGCSVVFVDHTAEYAVALDQTVVGDGGWLVLVVGSALVESLVRQVRVVVPGVLGQDSGGVAFVEDQDAVGALAADGTHEPLGITVRRGVRGGVVMIVMFSLRTRCRSWW